MRLDDEPASPRLIDITMYPPPKRKRRYTDGKKRREPRGGVDSYLTNPYGDLNPFEIEMAKSGASFEDLMFMRALQTQDERGFSPYFNPNYKRK